MKMKNKLKQQLKLQKQLKAAKRGLGLANKLKNPESQKLHKSRILRNMNYIRRMIAKY